MNNLRLILKTFLAQLATLAIKKHSMELIVILGVNGTEIIKELSYTVLSNKIAVRRIINKPWWDLSIPLSILGYKDEKRNPVQWMYMIIKSALYLAVGPKNPGTIILNLNYMHKDTMDFWSQFINPDILILANFNKNVPEVDKFVTNTINANGKIIMHEKSQFQLSKSTRNYNNLYLIGESGTAFLQSTVDKNFFKLSYKKEHESIDKKSLSIVPFDAFEFAICLGLLKQMTLNEAVYFGLRFDLPMVLSKIKNNLYKSEY